MRLPTTQCCCPPAEADLDAPKTFQDKVDEREKLRLIRLFFYGVCGYLIATIAVVFLPLFVPTVGGQHAHLVCVLLVAGIKVSRR